MSNTYTNKQAILATLTASSNEVYTPSADAQIRAFTVHNPTGANIEMTLSVDAKRMVSKTVTAKGTEILGAMFNQQLQKGNILNMTGTGLNIMLTVVEITE